MRSQVKILGVAQFSRSCSEMGAAVTKYHTDKDGYYKIDRICPGMSVDGKPVDCINPAESSSEEERKLAERKYFLVSDPVANPVMGSMLPFPVDSSGFFLDTMDHQTKKDIAGDASALQKTLYYMTTQRDPEGSAAEKVMSKQVPPTWCAHIKPCPAGVPCCPEVAPAIPVVHPPSAISELAEEAKKAWYQKGWLRTVVYLLIIAAVVVVGRRLLGSRSAGPAGRSFGRRRGPNPGINPQFNPDFAPSAPYAGFQQ